VGSCHGLEELCVTVETVQKSRGSQLGGGSENLWRVRCRVPVFNARAVRHGFKNEGKNRSPARKRDWRSPGGNRKIKKGAKSKKVTTREKFGVIKGDKLIKPHKKELTPALSGGHLQKRNPTHENAKRMEGGTFVETRERETRSRGHGESGLISKPELAKADGTTERGDVGQGEGGAGVGVTGGSIRMIRDEPWAGLFG